MEVLSQLSVDTFKTLVWVAAAVIGGLFVIGRPTISGLHIASRTVSAILAAAVSFVALNLAVVFYILAHLTDPRWSIGKDPKIDSPKLSAGPFFEPITNTLNDVLGTVTGSLNNAISIKNALFTIPDFIVLAGWGLQLLLPLVIALHFIGRAIKRRQARQIARNTQDLADIRSQLGLSPFDEKKFAALR
ncbi:hypothetical protein ACFRAU_04470 [Arthrobacter sp. NPDC056691]|uniref:hypothetical protein n=1 Tax=Arthrobacter sp. NPDC056691 TaxID=3345913 RepID=UPI00366FEDD7